MKKTAVFLLLALTVVQGIAFGAPGEEKPRIKETYRLEEGGIVDIDLNTGGDVRITGVRGERAELSVFVSGRDADNVEFDISGKDRGLYIKSEFKKRRKSNRCDVVLELQVPRRIDLKIETLGGELDVSDIHGAISGKTMGGELILRGIEGEINMKTMGGDVTVEGSRVDGEITTMGGDVDARDVKGELKTSTMGGDINYQGISAKETREKGEVVDIHTMGGDLDLDYPGKTVKAKTMGGDIDVPEARTIDVVTMGGDVEVGNVKDGVKARTMGGDIEVEYAGGYAEVKTMGGDLRLEEVDGWIKAVTMGGDVFARMAGDPENGERSVEITSKGGNIELHLPKGISASFDIEIEYTRDSREDYRIRSDFDLEVEEDQEWDNRFLKRDVKRIRGKGETEGGDNEIRIRTVNGNVTVRKD